MRFGKTLRNNIIKEWRFYSVDYKQLKQTLNGKRDVGSEILAHDELDSSNKQVNEQEFFRLLDESKTKLRKFCEDKEHWALAYIGTLEERVNQLRECASNAPSPASTAASGERTSLSDTEFSFDSFSDAEEEKQLEEFFFKDIPKKHVRSIGSSLKDEYRRVGQSEHFHSFIYAKKSLTTFARELSLLLEFTELNKLAFSKITKKFDKITGNSIRDKYMQELLSTHKFLEGTVLHTLNEHTSEMLCEVEELKPLLPEGWEDRKVYTIGCFDLFHRGHQNVLLSLREFGYFIVAGIHDDKSYFDLKKKNPIDNLETRMANVKPYVDQLYVIASTDPLPYIKCMVSEQDIETGRCCFARGDDMLQFPGRTWVESVMPVHFVPRTEACSSTLIRTIYHAGDSELRQQAAFAKTRYDGKPVDDCGNVLKLAPVLASKRLNC